MNKVPVPLNVSEHSRSSYLRVWLVLAIGVGALIAVLALPAIERIIWPEVTQELVR